jgi:hypothetical protein
MPSGSSPAPPARPSDPTEPRSRAAASAPDRRRRLRNRCARSSGARDRLPRERPARVDLTPVAAGADRGGAGLTSVWTGRLVVVVDRRHVTALDAHGNPYFGKSIDVAAAYDPRSQRWRKLEPPPGRPRGRNRRLDGTRADRLGRRLLWRCLLGRRRVQPVRWRPGALPDRSNERTGDWLPASGTRAGLRQPCRQEQAFRDGVRESERRRRAGAPVIASTGLRYVPERDSWSRLPRAPLLGPLQPAAVWTGDSLTVVRGRRRLHSGGGVRRPTRQSLPSSARAAPSRCACGSPLRRRRRSAARRSPRR